MENKNETGLIGNITAYGVCDSGVSMLDQKIETYEFSNTKDKKGEMKSNKCKILSKYDNNYKVQNNEIPIQAIY